MGGGEGNEFIVFVIFKGVPLVFDFIFVNLVVDIMGGGLATTDGMAGPLTGVQKNPLNSDSSWAGGLGEEESAAEVEPPAATVMMFEPPAGEQ